jgi:hypothetical protein
MTRRRWLYTQGGTPLPEPIEVTAEWTDAPTAHAPVTDLYMDGVRATDGTDIGSRAKRREYMQRNNLADADDFKSTWEHAAKERERERREGPKDPARREALVRAMNNPQTARAIAEASRKRARRFDE